MWKIDRPQTLTGAEGDMRSRRGHGIESRLLRVFFGICPLRERPFPTFLHTDLTFLDAQFRPGALHHLPVEPSPVGVAFDLAGPHRSIGKDACKKFLSLVLPRLFLVVLLDIAEDLAGGPLDHLAPDDATRFDAVRLYLFQRVT